MQSGEFVHALCAGDFLIWPQAAPARLRLNFMGGEEVDESDEKNKGQDGWRRARAAGQAGYRSSGDGAECTQ
jgi:hypothetical protein